jgi:hypothetical protein
MGKTKREIVQSVINDFRPEGYVRRIKCGFKPHEDGKTILVVQYTIQREKLGDKSIDKEKVLSWTRDLANKIRNIGKLPVAYTQTQVEYI